MDNVDRRDRDGRTALHMAACNGSADRVAELLAAGADVDARDNRGRGPLHLAAQEHALEVACCLLEAGATVDLKDDFGKTPLGTATFESQGRGEMIALLLEHGADPDAPNGTGISPRDLAKKIANYDVAQHFPPS